MNQTVMNPIGMDQTGMNPMGMNPMGMNQTGINPMEMNPMGMNQMGMNQMGINPMGMNPMEMNQTGMNPIEMNQMEMNQTRMNPMEMNQMGMNPMMNNMGMIGMNQPNLMDDNALRIKNIIQPYEAKIKQLEEIIRQKDLEITILKDKLSNNGSNIQNQNIMNINQSDEYNDPKLKSKYGYIWKRN